MNSREPAADVARVMSRYVDAMVVRCFEHQTIIDMAPLWAYSGDQRP